MIYEIRAKRAKICHFDSPCAWPADFAMTKYEYEVNRNDTFRGKRAENKMKQSNTVYNLVVAKIVILNV